MKVRVKKNAAPMSSTQEQRECRFRNEHGQCCLYATPEECRPTSEKDFKRHDVEQIQIEDVCKKRRWIVDYKIITSEDIKHLMKGGVLHLEGDDWDTFIRYADSYNKETKP